jgi:hypothetical protein
MSIMLLILSISMTTAVKCFPETAKSNAENLAGTSIQPPKLEWVKSYTGSSDDFPSSIMQTSDNGYILFGTHARSAFLIVKTDANGEEIWNKTFNREGYEIADAGIQTPDGGYAITGNTGFSFYDGDVWLVKIDKDGNEEWNVTYDISSYDEAFSIISTRDGGYAVVGQTDYGGLFIKTNSNGDLEWFQDYTTISRIYSVTETNDGRYALAGIVSGSGGLDICFAKTDEKGKIEWTKTFNAAEYDYAFKIVQTPDNGYMIAGQGSDHVACLIKADERGNMIWQQKYDVPGNVMCATNTRDGGFVFGCYTYWTWKLLLLKFNRAGVIEWQGEYDASLKLQPGCLTQTNDGGFAMASFVLGEGLWCFSLAKFSATTEEGLQLKILDRNKWYTAQVPFEDDIEKATQYIDNFDEKNPKPLDYGNLPLTIELQNTVNRPIENVVCEANISGVMALIHLSGEAISKDKKAFCPFPDYQISKQIGTIEAGKTQKVTLEIPIWFMSVIAGELVIDKGNEWENELRIGVLFTIVALNIQLNITGSDCIPIEDQTIVFAYGNPRQLLGTIIEDLKQRCEYHRIEALKQLLEMHIGVLALCTKSLTIDVKAYPFNTIVPIEPGTTSFTIGTILGSATLIGLTAILTDSVQGIISTLSVFSPIVPGFAMVTFTGIDKLIPKGQLSVDIILQKQSETATNRIALVSQQNSNVTLIATSKFEPQYFNVPSGNKDYQIAIASNVTNLNFYMDEHNIIRLNVTGIQNSAHFLKVTIPNEIMTDNFKVWVDSSEIYDFNMTQSTTYSTLYFTYNSFGTSEIEIIPELPSPMFLVFFLILPLLALFAAQKRRKKNQDH